MAKEFCRIVSESENEYQVRSSLPDRYCNVSVISSYF